MSRYKHGKKRIAGFLPIVCDGQVTKLRAREPGLFQIQPKAACAVEELGEALPDEDLVIESKGHFTAEQAGPLHLDLDLNVAATFTVGDDLLRSFNRGDAVVPL